VANRSYEQYCPIAGALDVLGERWTLLILRELLQGPQRFTDLRRHLPGIAPNLLAERLRSMEEHGLVSQEELPPPAARSVYVATAEGRATAPVLTALASYGMRTLPSPTAGEVRPSMAVWGALTPRLDPVAASARDLVIRLEIGDRTYDLALRAGRIRRPPAPTTPDVTVSGSPEALVEVCQGSRTLADAAADTSLVVDGSAIARRHFAAAFALN
jgi:DNA-binding HxlR family transcriptional regulator